MLKYGTNCILSTKIYNSSVEGHYFLQCPKVLTQAFTRDQCWEIWFRFYSFMAVVSFSIYNFLMLFAYSYNSDVHISNTSLAHSKI